MHNILVVGGGFYGCLIAAALASQNKNVVLAETQNQIFDRASRNNQARVHGGYHYPRSYMTARRSKINFKLFSDKFPESIFKNYENIYAVARKFSNISANQFEQFCNRVGAPLSEVSNKAASLFNDEFIEKAFLTTETSFDWLSLKDYCLNELHKKKVQLKLSTKALRLARNSSGSFDVTLSANGTVDKLKFDEIYICTYSEINDLLQNSNLPLINFHYELTEMALVLPPHELRHFGITVMDGPFWSFMPYPARNLHTLTHVRYTPHYAWKDEDDQHAKLINHAQLKKKSNYLKMIADGARYVPLLKESTYVDSLWEIKTILPRSSLNDSRPILFQKNFSAPNLNLVLGGKIDNIFDVLKEL